MSMSQKWFDSDAELQKLRDTPPKVAKVPKEGEENTLWTDAELQNLRWTPPKVPKAPKAEEEQISHFSHFRWGEGEKSPFSPAPHPEGFFDDGRDMEGAPLPTFYQEWCGAMPNPDILTVFPKWRAILVTSTVLGLSVWVANTWDDAISLSQETGQPALLLSDVLREKGKSAAETRATLLSKLINALRS